MAKSGRGGVSTAILAVIVVVIVMGAAVGYYALSSGGTAMNTTSSQTSTSSHSSSTSGSSGSVVIQLLANPPYAAPDIVANYTLNLIILGSLSSELVVSASAPAGFTVSVSPGSVKQGSGTSAAVLSIKVSDAVSPGMYRLNISAAAQGMLGGGNTFSQSFTVQVVRYLVAMVGTTFVPASLTVPTGSTVYWIRLNGAIDQYDDGGHNVVFGGGYASSAVLEQYLTFSYTFISAGSFDYRCTLHPGMQGVVVAA